MANFKLWALDTGKMSFDGRFFEALKFIEDFQLLDEKLWTVFVKLFETNPDDKDLGWRSEFWGKMMRGAALVYRYTKNERLFEIMEKSVRNLLTTADSLGRITTYSIEKEFRQWDIWGRKYVLLGLEYFLEICADEKLKDGIISSMRRQADYIISKVGNSEGKIPITHTSEFWEGLNSSSLLEPIVRLYRITGDEKYLDFAHEIVRCGGTKNFDIFKAALEGKLYPYQYPVTKAYEMMSCFEGILQLYMVSDNPDYLKMAENFARLVIDSDITIIGNAGCTHELFDNSRARQFDPAFTGIMQETCVAVTWMKFFFQLLSLTGKALYADEIEKTALNSLLGSVNFEKNKMDGVTLPVDSYSPLLFARRGQAVGGKKDLKDINYYGCCAAINAAGFGIGALFSVMSSYSGIAINMYHSGVAEFETPDGKNVILRIEGNYPTQGDIKIYIEPETQSKFAVSLRIPEWSDMTSVKVCGEEARAEKGSYAVIDRLWKKGDIIELRLNMDIKVIEAEDIEPNAPEAALKHFALKKGPIVLARDSALEGEDIRIPVKSENGKVKIKEIKPTKTADFKTQAEYEIVFSKGDRIRVIDYASAGGVWSEDRIISAWLNKE
ncbi:MAG TPA: glycoside hydrolase family 127 protein [Clostridiales bacterium]|jgi:DUF1680 family protein|nr:glycoside hydrolase family 127 protein [Clostridiales bacterium]HQD71813.1 glycoside hydrolase family 127 protein [Clostridiales bacterium]